MGKLAIRGHATRGKEVIEILEMLGGKSSEKLAGHATFCGYYINQKGCIDYVDCCCLNCYVIQYTLEKFFEKYPYKVGDKVIYEDKRREITKMVWEEQTNTVAYKLDDKIYCNVINNLQPYKEEIMEKRQYEELRMPLDDNDKLATEATIDGNKIRPPKNYLIGKITKVNNGLLVEFVKKQPEYPKNYKECCKVLGISRHDVEIDIPQPYQQNMFNLFKLLICRDAYWKIAGEEMGLGKPWGPDYKNPDIDLYVIINIYNRAEKAKYGYGFQQCVLTFPTAEMRDTFYENFKSLIEECKELL